MPRGRFSQVEITLSPTTEAQLLELVRNPFYPPGVARRVQVVLLRAQGLTITEIIRRTGMSRRHIYKWLTRYTASGPSVLALLPTGRQGWQCPGCQRGYSPSVDQCLHCGPPTTRRDESHAGLAGG